MFPNVCWPAIAWSRWVCYAALQTRASKRGLLCCLIAPSYSRFQSRCFKSRVAKHASPKAHKAVCQEQSQASPSAAPHAVQVVRGLEQAHRLSERQQRRRAAAGAHQQRPADRQGGQRGAAPGPAGGPGLPAGVRAGLARAAGALWRRARHRAHGHQVCMQTHGLRLRVLASPPLAETGVCKTVAPTDNYPDQPCRCMCEGL